MLGGIEETRFTNNINFYFPLGPPPFDDGSPCQETTTMKSKDIILSIAFFSQTGVGVLGNSFLICLFIFMFLDGHRMRPIDAIVTQLALVNCLVLLLKGIPHTMAALGLMDSLDDTGCKIISYLHKVARDLSLSMTCILSVFQAITISPSNYNWMGLKARAPKYLLHSSLFCWTVHLFFSSFIPWGVKGPRQNRNFTETQNNGYCSHIILSRSSASLVATLLSCPDVMYLGLMVSASGYMVILLYRHHKQMKQIHMTCFSSRASPETRASKSILLLVSTFISSYLLTCILAAYMTLVKPPLWLRHTYAFLDLLFPAISPYVLISNDSQIPRYLYALCGRKISHFDPDKRVISSAQDDFLKARVRGKEISG